MIEWADDAIVLSVRPHGESAVILSVLTRDHGRHAGLVHGGAGRGKRGILQPGNTLHVWWKGRLPDSLGSYRVELDRSHAAHIMDRAAPLCALSAAMAVCDVILPEHHPHAALYQATLALLTALYSDAWPSVYVHWELALLRDLGFGLDLGQCAATGSNDHLAYVSPKSGRAVSRSAGEPYQDKLLPLPDFLLSGQEGDDRAIAQGLALTGFFLTRHALPPHHLGLPAARDRLLSLFTHPRRIG